MEEEEEKPPFPQREQQHIKYLPYEGTIPSASGSWCLPCLNGRATHFCQHVNDRTECITNTGSLDETK